MRYPLKFRDTGVEVRRGHIGIAETSAFVDVVHQMRAVSFVGEAIACIKSCGDYGEAVIGEQEILWRGFCRRCGRCDFVLLCCGEIASTNHQQEYGAIS